MKSKWNTRSSNDEGFQRNVLLEFQRNVLRMRRLPLIRLLRGLHNFESQRQGKPILGGRPTSGASLDPLIFATEIAFGASLDFSQ